MPTINNYTFSPVSFQVEEQDDIIDSIGQNFATITIYPNDGFTVAASDFSASGYNESYIDNVEFVQSGSNVICNVFFVAGITMPSANVDLALCVTGQGVVNEITIAGTFTANVGSNVTGDSSETNTPYSNSGVFGETELLFSKTYTAAANHYLDVGAGMQIVQGIQSNYNIAQTPTYDSENRLTSITYDVNYIYPNENISGDKIAIRLIKGIEIFVKPQYVTNYQFPYSAVSGSGATLIYYVHGQEGATFSLNVTAANGSNFTPANNVTIPANGIYEVEIDFPDINAESYQSETYTLTISGDLEPNFSQPTSITVVQSVKIPRLTFTATTTGSMTGFTPIETSSVAFSDFTKNPRKVYIDWILTSPNVLGLKTPSDEIKMQGSENFNFGTTAAVANSSTMTVDDTSNLAAGYKFNLYQYSGRGEFKYEITSIDSLTQISVTPNITVANNTAISAFNNNGNVINIEDVLLTQNAETGDVTLKATINIEYFGSDDATFTLDLDELIEEIPSITCAAQTNNGSTGVTDHMLDLDPAGGLIAFLVNAQSLEDKFEIIHGTPGSNFFVKKATSSMKAADNFGPFENNFGTEPANQLPTSTEVNNIDQFIGLSSGSVPTRETEFNLDTDFDITSMTVGAVTYQQVIWWEYTAADYTANPNASLRVTGPSGTAWNILRLCCPDANCQAFVPSPFGLTAANTSAANACADTSYVNTIYVSYDQFKLGKTVYTDSGLTTGNEFVGDGTSFYGVDDTPEIAIKIDANGVIIDYIHLCI